MNNIRIVCKHVVHLLNNLLDVYRLNEAKETRNDVPFSLKDLLERTVFGFSHVINNKGVLFCHDFKDTDVKLYGDVDRIEQIIDNLLSNAVKFTEVGTISFNACYHEGELLLEVKDTGIGMSEETLSRIFRPFERLSSLANVQGFGLGLPITKGLVNLLGGTINVTSSIDQGSTFRVTLPMKMTFAYVSQTPYPDVPLPCIQVTDIRQAMGLLADAAYGHPSGQLRITGITGTKGKTTTAYYLKSILDIWLEGQGRRASALLSTIVTDDGVERVPPSSPRRNRWTCSATCGTPPRRRRTI